MTEDDPTLTPGGFALTDITCDDTNSTGDAGTRTATIELDPGETVTCTFTNAQPGTIVVEKLTDPDPERNRGPDASEVDVRIDQSSNTLDFFINHNFEPPIFCCAGNVVSISAP